MYESWRAVADALGFEERPQPQTLAELLENPDPHARLAASLKTALDADARSMGRKTTDTTRNNEARVKELTATLELTVH